MKEDQHKLWRVFKKLVVACAIIIGIYSIYDMHKTLEAVQSRQELHRQALVEILYYLDSQTQ